MGNGSEAPGVEPAVVGLRRANSLVAHWSDGEFHLHNYLTNTRSSVSPGIVQLLHELGDYRPETEVVEALGESAALTLVERNILVAQGSPAAERDSALEDTWAWGVEARHFHYVTQAVRFENQPALEREMLGPLLADRPNAVKDYGRSDVALPGTFDSRHDALWDALRSRRTRRSFQREPITSDELATILLWTWGARDVRDDAGLGTYLLKTSPSGGARHPVEVYPAVLRVDGVEPGLYHYSVGRHSLERLGELPSERELVRLCGTQEWIADAAVVFFMTAVVTRSMWKYPNAHAYRVMLLDAGHLGQTMHLVCTHLGLGPFTTAAIQGSEVEEMLGVDGVGELAVYAAAVGRPRPESGAPTSDDSGEDHASAFNRPDRKSAT